jgi:HD-GYP domain-containing protein (c-di-GMP phosphodiesterase class II)
VQILLEEMLALINSPAGAIWLYEPADDELQQVIARGWFAEQPRARKPGEGLAGSVFLSGQAQVSREFRSHPGKHDTIRATQPEGWGGAVVPIRTADQVIGVLVVAMQLPREATPEDVHLLTTLAEIAGNVIHRSRLHQLTLSQLRHTAALHRIDTAISASHDLQSTLYSVIDEVLAQLDVDAADVLLYRTHTLQYAAGRGFLTRGIERSQGRLGEGQSGSAAMERRMIGVPDLAHADIPFRRAALLAGEHFVSHYAAPLIAKGEVRGVLEIFHRTRLDPASERLQIFEALATQAAIAIENSALLDDLQQSNMALGMAYEATIEGWSRALDMRDHETEGHSRRVTEMTLTLARAVGIADGELLHLRRGALPHDIGKMGVPDSILLKPGALSEEEWLVMRRHPVFAYELLSPIPFLQRALDIPYCHH